MKAEEVLDRAKELIARPGGWRQGTYEYQGSYCALGAIHAAYNLYQQGVITQPASDCSRATQVLRKVVTQAGHMGITTWNDSTKRTQAEVVEMFEKAIAAAAEVDV